MIKLLWHVWRKGHSVRVNKGITVAMIDPSKGWLYVCECGMGGGEVTRPSNGTEGEAWMAAWCGTCKKDVSENCPWVLMGLLGDEDPAVWHRGPNWSPQTVMYCTDYEEK